MLGIKKAEKGKKVDEDANNEDIKTRTRRRMKRKIVEEGKGNSSIYVCHT